MLGQESAQRELFRPDNLFLDHVGEDSLVAIREGAMLYVEGEKATLRGRNGGVVFQAGQPLGGS